MQNRIRRAQWSAKTLLQMTFNYFLGDDLDAKQAGVLERYKNYNGMREQLTDSDR